MILPQKEKMIRGILTLVEYNSDKSELFYGAGWDKIK